jgi:hypothetical protein
MIDLLKLKLDFLKINILLNNFIGFNFIWKIVLKSHQIVGKVLSKYIFKILLAQPIKIK